MGAGALWWTERICITNALLDQRARASAQSSWLNSLKAEKLTSAAGSPSKSSSVIAFAVAKTAFALTIRSAMAVLSFSTISEVADARFCTWENKHGGDLATPVHHKQTKNRGKSLLFQS